LAVACVGVMAPFLLGWAVLRLLGHAGIECILVGASLTATSIGITARVLSDLGKLGKTEAQIVLGAAVIDDILGIIILSVVQEMAKTGQTSWSSVVWPTVLAVLFFGVAILLGPSISKKVMKLIEGTKSRGILITAALCFAFGLALIAHAMGTALIVGAFTAGLLLAQTEHKSHIREALTPIADIFVPVFFVMVGSKMDLGQLNPFIATNRGIIYLMLLLIFVAIVGKIAAGAGVWKKGLNRWSIGIGMIPRGEVGLIFAQIGLATEIIGVPMYTAVVGMVIVTTLITPPLLKKVFR
jgi:Kef-type K+ transport system membrane component KefB